MKKLSYGIGAAALLSLGACAEGPANNGDDFGYKGTGIAFGVSPLTLDSLTDACYSFAVVNASNNLVVGRGPGAANAHTGLVNGTAANSLCASQFGNGDGGDISYVAPCDASISPTDETVHTVTLWVDALCTTGNGDATQQPNYFAPNSICPEMQAYVNPCGVVGCDLQVTCVENADTPVEFNFTIMGQADQGFFDIAVNFDDVFCSAKLDDCNTNGEKIDLMFDATTGARINTIVAAVSCTGGPGDGVDTQLNFTPLVVNCLSDSTGGSLDLSSVGEEGNVLIGTGLYPSAVYYGTESLEGVNKVYTTVAIGIGDRSDCTLQWNVVPTNGPFAASSDSGIYSSYGFVNFAGRDLGGSDCHANPLNGESSGVKTSYAPTDPDPGPAITAFLTEDGADGTTVTFQGTPTQQ